MRKPFVRDVLDRITLDRNIMRTKYYRKSPYQKRRFKPEFVGAEIWLYRIGQPTGFLITETDWNEMSETQKEETIESFEK